MDVQPAILRTPEDSRRHEEAERDGDDEIGVARGRPAGEGVAVVEGEV